MELTGETRILETNYTNWRTGWKPVLYWRRPPGLLPDRYLAVNHWVFLIPGILSAKKMLFESMTGQVATCPYLRTYLL